MTIIRQDNNLPHYTFTMEIKQRIRAGNFTKTERTIAA